MPVTLAAVKQEITDFKNEVLSDLKEIKKQTGETNNRVNKHDTAIELLKRTQKGNMSTKEWTKLIAPPILAAVLTAIIMNFL